LHHRGRGGSAEVELFCATFAFFALEGLAAILNYLNLLTAKDAKAAKKRKRGEQIHAEKLGQYLRGVVRRQRGGSLRASRRALL
jgi:hypothetical protein